MIYLFSPKKAIKSAKGVAKKAVKKTVQTGKTGLDFTKNVATGDISGAFGNIGDLITDNIPGLKAPKVEAPSIASLPGPDAVEAAQKTADKEATKEASRRSAVAGQGQGFQSTLLTGFAGGASGDQVKRKTLLG